MNVELLQKVRAKILENPECLGMEEWTNECGTVACIAGHTCLLSDMKPIPMLGTIAGNIVIGFDTIQNVLILAGNLLDIPLDEVGELFYVEDWPYEFQDRYNEAKDHQEVAQVVADRIDYFIEHQE